jgi:YYY domain-containing protein
VIVSIFIWWITAQAFGLIGLPLTYWLFRALPDRGYAFSKSLGLLLTGYLAWLLAMLGLAPFGRVLVVVCALAVCIVGLLLTRAQRTGGNPQADAADDAVKSFTVLNIRFSIPQNWRMLLAYEVIFAVAFLALLRMRGYDYGILVSPNPYGTERPMDYALFNAIRVSANFPPHDPWLAGYSINYYYFGYLLMAVVSLASGIGEGLAYNLSLALIFGLTALGIAGIIVNLIGLTTKDEGRKTKDESGIRRWSFVVRPMSAALLTIVLVLGVGNQGAALQVVSGVNMFLALDGPDMARAIANGLGTRQPLQIEPPFRGFDFDGTSVITPEDRVANFDWWTPSRALWDSYPPAPGDADQRPTKRYDITEFPFFSFWLGDMHPHVMALPFGLLALALALQTAARPTAPNYTMGRRGWAELALTGIILGSLYLINSWDLPTYVLLFLGALLILYIRLGRGLSAAPSVARLGIVQANLQSAIANVWWQHYLTQAVTALLAAWILFTPFHLTFHSLVSGRGVPLGLVTSSKTSLPSFLIIFGLFLLPLLAYVYVQGHSNQATTPEARKTIADEVSDETDASSPGHPATPSPWRYAPWVILGSLLFGIALGFPLLALLPLAIYAVKLALDRVERPAAAFVLWGFALGCLICFGTEIVYIRDVFEGSSARMNTIFKFYYQVWLIWGVLAGYAVWWLAVGRTTKDERRMSKASFVPRPSSVIRRYSVDLLFGVLFVALLAGGLVYPALTAGKMVREVAWSGIAGITPREKTPAGAAGIAWLRENVPGSAVVLEAVGESYDSGYSGLGFGQVSGSTGLATVLGWPGHEEQWRGGHPDARTQIGPRRTDVATIYSTTDTQQAGELLKKYNVDYIYVGAAERKTYPAEGLAKLGELGDVVFQQGEVVIYRVKK